MATEGLDLEEGKRLLSAWRDAYRTANAMGMDTPGSKPAWDAVSLRSRQATNWLHANADAVIAVAEEAEKLRAVVKAALSALDERAAGRGGELHVAAAALILRDALAALTPPEPLPAQQETP